MEHGGSWRSAENWPPTSEQLVLFLHEDQALRLTPPTTEATISYDFDPRDPVPTLGGAITSGEPVMQGGAFDQSPSATTFGARSRLPLASRSDVVSFQTEPLNTPISLAGSIEVELRFSSSATDTDVSVKVVDVYPPNEDYPLGFAMNVADGMLRCRFRDGFSKSELMEPDTEYTLVIPMPDAANLFAQGHRIRLDVSSSNFPRSEVNPNTGKQVMSDRTWQIARNTLHLGPSLLRIDVLGQGA
jgi:hypothetical protein